MHFSLIEKTCEPPQTNHPNRNFCLFVLFGIVILHSDRMVAGAAMHVSYKNEQRFTPSQSTFFEIENVHDGVLQSPWVLTCKTENSFHFSWEYTYLFFQD